MQQTLSNTLNPEVPLPANLFREVRRELTSSLLDMAGVNSIFPAGKTGSRRRVAVVHAEIRMSIFCKWSLFWPGSGA
jgi:hypothetical protein